MDYFSKNKEEVLNIFNSSEDGLKEIDIDKLREKYGFNEFTKVKSESLLKKIINSLKEPMMLILIVALVITVGINVVKLFQGMHMEWIESIGILLAIALSVSISIITEGKSQKAFDSLNEINEGILVKVIRNKNVKQVVKKELLPGDIVILETGDKVPADGRLLKTNDLQVDESMLTGESLAVKKDSEIIIDKEKSSLSDRINMVYSGTYITFGNGIMVVTNTGDDTEMGEIASELQKDGDASTPLQEKLGTLGKNIAKIGAFIAFIVFAIKIYKLFVTNNFTLDTVGQALTTSIALIVASVPEGLPTIVAATLALNVIKMSKHNALVKKIVACETIGSVNVICSDKTGTLTKNQMSVIDVFHDGKLISNKDFDADKMITNFKINCSAKQEKDGKYIGNATEVALLNSVNSKNISKDINLIHQYPFSSDKKCMTSITNENNNIIAYTKGSPENIISFCSKAIINGKEVDLDDKIRISIENHIENFQKQAKRILAFSHKDIDKESNYLDDEKNILKDMIFDGFVSIADPIRDDVYDAVKVCTSAGIDIKMLTGDNIVTARAIANDLGLLSKDSIVCQASDIDDMSDEELKNILPRIKVIARSKPLTKMRVVETLINLGNSVGVTGDGINDAPALKKSDVGIAMGITGTQVSKEASDMVLLDDSFATIVKSVGWGRSIYENFQRFIQFQLTVNVAAVLVVLLAELFNFSSPFTPIQLLWINIIMDGPLAITLGIEAMRSNIMNDKPIKRDANIITKDMFKRISFGGLYIVLVIMVLMNTNFIGGEAYQKHTIVFNTFVLFALFNVFNSRKLDDESILKNFFTNKVLFKVFTLVLIMQIFASQYLNDIFNTVKLDLLLWIKIFATSLSIIVVFELTRFIRRNMKKSVKSDVLDTQKQDKQIA